MEINSLKKESKIKEIENRIDGLIDLFYPVGSFYESSNVNFDPNIEWGGEWVQDTVGYVTVGANVNEDSEVAKHNLVDLAVNETKGEAKHTLLEEELAVHMHPANNFVFNPQRVSGNPNTVNVGTGSGILAFDRNGDVNLTVNSAGSSTPFNITQPSIGIIRWHRIT